MGTFFDEGGWGMFPTAIFGFLLAASAVLTLLRPARFWALTAVLAAVTVAAGLLGATMGLINTFKYVSHGSDEPAAAARIALQGMAESLNNVVLALVLVIPSLLVCAVAAFRALRAAPAAK